MNPGSIVSVEEWLVIASGIQSTYQDGFFTMKSVPSGEEKCLLHLTKVFSHTYLVHQSIILNRLKAELRAAGHRFLIIEDRIEKRLKTTISNVLTKAAGGHVHLLFALQHSSYVLHVTPL